MKNLKVLIMGSDANAYHMARSCYEEYQIKAHLIGKTRLAFTKFSDILTIEYNDDLWDESYAKMVLNQMRRYVRAQESNISWKVLNLELHGISVIQRQ